MGIFGYPLGKAKLQDVYRRPDGSQILVWEGSNGSTVPPEADNNGETFLSLYFPFIEPTEQLRKLRNGR